MKSQRLSRRTFVQRTATVVFGAPLLMSPYRLQAASEDKYVREAKYYEKLSEKRIRCQLCPHECQVADLERGTCGVRENRGGVYYTLVYGNPCAVHVDPIEKKPLFHYYPASQAFSLATAGCNFSCRFCQNWEISQKRPEQVSAIDLLPERVIAGARQYRCRIVSHTYTEPVVFFEYMLDCAVAGRESGIPNVMISNGYIQKKPMRELCRYLGAVKIDLKAFTEKFYQEQCGGKLQPVLDTLLLLRGEKVWFEVVVLIIPTLNDSPQEIDRMTRWIHRELGPAVPLHFTRYFPTFMIRNIPATPSATLTRAREIAMGNGLQFVYVGNVLSDAENTFCPACKKTLIERVSYAVNVVGMKGNACKFCGAKIPGVFS